MKRIVLPDHADFDAWRREARACLQLGLPPTDILWPGGDEAMRRDLFENIYTAKIAPVYKQIGVPAAFIDLARIAIRHRDEDRYAFLYRVLWRVTNSDRMLMHKTTDSDIMRLNRMVKSVRRDAYKIKAFLRFRETSDGAFVAWYTPEHDSLELTLPFFTDRFRHMRWSILTPLRGAHWDGKKCLITLNPDPSLVPRDDDVEKYWLTYYASIFNPARTKTKAMLAQMPKKYWHNMPETALIKPMLQGSAQRVDDMIRTDERTNNAKHR